MFLYLLPSISGNCRHLRTSYNRLSCLYALSIDSFLAANPTSSASVSPLASGFDDESADACAASSIAFTVSLPLINAVGSAMKLLIFEELLAASVIIFSTSI